MPKMQMLEAHVNLGGDRGNVVVRDRYNPISYPEMLLLRVIHGGEDHVHSLAESDRVEVSIPEERERLRMKYGALVDEVFPGANAGGVFPLVDDSLPTVDDVLAANAAAAGALAARKTKKAKDAKSEAPAPAAPAAPVVPDLTSLPQ